MRILNVIHGYKPAFRLGGPIYTLSAVAERMVKRGHEVIVFATNSNLDEDLEVPTDIPLDIEGVEVWYFAHREPIKKWLPFLPYLSKSIGFLYAPAMRKELETIIPTVDVVHTQMPFVYPTYIAGRIAIKEQKPLFYQQHGVFAPESLRFRSFKKRLYIKAIERPIMQKATALIALTEAEVSNYRALGVQTPAKVIPNGVEIENYDKACFDEAELRFAISAQEQLILFMARLHPTKGADKLIEAFLSIAEGNPKVKLVMAGPDEWDMVDIYRQAIKATGMEQRVIFTGMVTGRDKKILLDRADLFCLPSKAEGFSIAILEAMAARTAVLISPGCHFPAVEQTNSGLIVQPSVENLAKALSTLLDDRQGLKTMGNNAYDLVRKDYSWDNIVASLISVYEEGIWKMRQ